MSDIDKTEKVSKDCEEISIKSEESEEESFRSFNSDIQDTSAFDYDLLTEVEVSELFETAESIQLEKRALENLPAFAAEILNTSNFYYQLAPEHHSYAEFLIHQQKHRETVEMADQKFPQIDRWLELLVMDGAN